MQQIAIALANKDLRVITQCLKEFGGGSTEVMERLSGRESGVVRQVEEKIDVIRESPPDAVTLSESEWRIIYDSVNSALYALGPFELEICTGFGPIDLLQTNLKIASAVWGAYGGAQWPDYYEIRRK